MNESNNVKFAEAEGKWLWKRYDEKGSVIYRSSLFNTEREAREDYDVNGGDTQDSAPENSTTTDTVPTAHEESNTSGTATNDESQDKQPEDNNAGQATI